MRRFTLSFIESETEQAYQDYMGKKYLHTFRFCYLFSVVVLLLKMIFKLSENHQLKNSNISTTELEELKVEETRYLVTLALGCCVLLSSLSLSYWRAFFIKIHVQINLVVFLVLGFVVVIISNLIKGGTEDFSLVADSYLLFFPFALLLRISFPVSIVGGWALILFFIILRFVGTLQMPAGTFVLTTIFFYLSVGVIAFSFLSYNLEKMERAIFPCILKKESNFGALQAILIPPLEETRLSTCSNSS